MLGVLVRLRRQILGCNVRVTCHDCGCFMLTSPRQPHLRKCIVGGLYMMSRGSADSMKFKNTTALVHQLIPVHSNDRSLLSLMCCRQLPSVVAAESGILILQLKRAV